MRDIAHPCSHALLCRHREHGPREHHLAVHPRAVHLPGSHLRRRRAHHAERVRRHRRRPGVRISVCYWACLRVLRWRARFRYTTAVKNAFSGGGISSLQNLDNQGEIPSALRRPRWLTRCGQAGCRARRRTCSSRTMTRSGCAPSCSYIYGFRDLTEETERQLAQQQLPVQHLRHRDDLLARAPVRHTDDPLELLRLHEHGRRRAERRYVRLLQHQYIVEPISRCILCRRGDVHDRRRHERLAVPAPLGGRRGHGRLPQPRRHGAAHELGVAAGGADRLWPRYVCPSQLMRRGGEGRLTGMGGRRARVRGDQQRGRRVERHVRDVPAGRDVLRRRRRGERRRRVHR